MNTKNYNPPLSIIMDKIHDFMPTSVETNLEQYAGSLYKQVDVHKTLYTIEGTLATAFYNPDTYQDEDEVFDVALNKDEFFSSKNDFYEWISDILRDTPYYIYSLEYFVDPYIEEHNEGWTVNIDFKLHLSNRDD